MSNICQKCAKTKNIPSVQEKFPVNKKKVSSVSKNMSKVCQKCAKTKNVPSVHKNVPNEQEKFPVCKKSSQFARKSEQVNKILVDNWKKHPSVQINQKS